MSLEPRYGDSTPIVAYTPWRVRQNPAVEGKNTRHFAVGVAQLLARLSQGTTALLETVSWQSTLPIHTGRHTQSWCLSREFSCSS